MKPEVTPAAPARPVNPYLMHSGISAQPLSPWSFSPAAQPATQPAVKPAPAAPAVPAPVQAPAPAPAPAPVAAPAPAAAPATPVAAVAPPPVEAAKPAPAAKVEAAPAASEAARDAVVLFRFNSSRLTPEARKLLDGWLASAPKGVKIFVTGHADRIGSARYNKKLSLRRAKSVRAYLVSKGVSAKGVTVAAKGYAAPVKACEGKVSRAIIVCLAPNRRVEVKP